MFSYTEEQIKKLKEWQDNHNCKLSDDPNFPGEKAIGAIGGRFTHLFTPTSLGVIEKVKCGCGAEIDLTNYDW